MDSHELQDGKVEILDVVNPGLYWIKCPYCLPISTISSFLNEHINKEVLKGVSRTCFSPKVNERVIFEDLDGTLYRGIIRKHESPKYYVRLIDACKEVKVQNTLLYPSTIITYNSLEKQAHLVGVFGLIPFEISDQHCITYSFIENLRRWNSFNPEINDILDSYKNVTVFKIKCYIDDIPYGKFKLFDGTKVYSLSKVIVDKNIGVESTDFPKDIIGTQFTELIAEKSKIKQPVDVTVQKETRASVKKKPKFKVSPQRNLIITALANGIVLDSTLLTEGAKNISVAPLENFYKSLIKSSKLTRNQPDKLSGSCNKTSNNQEIIEISTFSSWKNITKEVMSDNSNVKMNDGDEERKLQVNIVNAAATCNEQENSEEKIKYLSNPREPLEPKVGCGRGKLLKQLFKSHHQKPEDNKFPSENKSHDQSSVNSNADESNKKEIHCVMEQPSLNADEHFNSKKDLDLAPQVPLNQPQKSDCIKSNLDNNIATQNINSQHSNQIDYYNSGSRHKKGTMSVSRKVEHTENVKKSNKKKGPPKITISVPQDTSYQSAQICEKAQPLREVFIDNDPYKQVDLPSKMKSKEYVTSSDSKEDLCKTFPKLDDSESSNSCKTDSFETCVPDTEKNLTELKVYRKGAGRAAIFKALVSQTSLLGRASKHMDDNVKACHQFSDAESDELLQPEKNIQKSTQRVLNKSELPDSVSFKNQAKNNANDKEEISQSSELPHHKIQGAASLSKKLGRGKLLSFPSQLATTSTPLPSISSDTDCRESLDISSIQQASSTEISDIERMTEQKRTINLLKPNAYNKQTNSNENLKGIIDLSKDLNGTEEQTNLLDSSDDDFFNPDLNKNNLSLDKSSSTLSESAEEKLSVFPEYVKEELSSSFGTSSSEAENEKPKITELEEKYKDTFHIGENLERMKGIGGILHGNTQTKLAPSLQAIPLNKLIMANLSFRRVTDLTRCQIFSIPVLLENRNFVLVGPPKTKKTTCYLLPLLTLLLNEEYYSMLKDGNGPKGVIIVPTAQRVRYVASLSSSFCGARINIITTHGGGLELERKDELINGCDLLITTPRCWLRLLNQPHVTNIRRLCHIVFDSVDTLFDLFLDELREIYIKIASLEKYRKQFNIKYGIQMVFIAESWSKILEEITLSKIKNPVLCITAHLEAALYARIKPTLVILKKGNKLKKFLKLISDNNLVRTVVVCKDASEVKNVRPSLCNYRGNVLVAHEDMHHSILQDIRNSWISHMEGTMLLCSDAVVADLCITNAQWLINYSISESKSVFSERFSVIKEHFYDRIKNPQAGVPNCKVHIFLEDGNETQFPDIIKFIERINAKIPDHFKTSVKMIEEAKEKSKHDEAFCDRMLQFGRCWKRDTCKKRHIINVHKDKHSLIPSKGYLKMKILRVHDATHFSVRILAHTSDMNITDISEVHWDSFPSSYGVICLQMTQYFKNRENRRLHGRPKVGDYVAIQKEADILFLRGEVLEITARGPRLDPVEVLLVLIDEGLKTKMKVDELYELPTFLHEPPPQAVDVFLGNLRPVDLDNAWSYAATKVVERSINEADEKSNSNSFYMGKINLVIGRNIIMESICCYVQLNISKCYIVQLSLRQHMLKSGFALDSPNHIKVLTNLCIAANLIDPPKELKQREAVKLSLNKTVWAHLPKDSLIQVILSIAENPSLFFVTQVQLNDRLINLNKDLKKSLDERQRRLPIVEIGSLCAVKNPGDNEWNRATVLNVCENSEVEVFFVDYGDRVIVNVDQLFTLPDELVTRLPFQAVECGLCGIIPLKSQFWCNEATESLHVMTESDAYKKVLYLKVCEIKLKADITGGRHYDVIIVDTDSNPDFDRYINVNMVYKGYANWNFETKHYLDNAPKEFEAIAKRDTSANTQDLQYEADDEEDEDWDKSCTNKQISLFNGSYADVDSSLACPSDTSNSQSQNDVIDVGNFELVGVDSLVNSYMKKFGFDTNTATKSPLPALLPKQSSCTDVESEDQQNNTDHFEVTKSPHPEIDEILESDVSVDFGEDDDDLNGEEDEIPHVETVTRILTPNVYWRQNPNHVWIKILIPDVKLYKLFYTYSYLIFLAFVNGKIYWLDINFFGPTVSEGFSYKLTGQYVEVKLEKTLKGHEWFRLTYSKAKAHHIKLDPSSKQPLDPFEESYVDAFLKIGEERQKLTVNSSHESRENISRNAFAYPDRNSETESDTGSDLHEFDPIPNDPFDPLC
ncbi:putative ATP-dependent RNA helicase TDRD12 isoform X2 [Cimex lectularius]|nr:putative ATP-dependent RNA helicase TDRD12 isoform X2 [Cimex lectularius]XP_024082241.1 putative ATP-dependent RNA helicase TDRD12 isoform X2 [Cimex lectularius]